MSADTFSEAEIKARLLAAAKKRGADPVGLVTEQADHLASLAGQVSRAVLGDERAQAALEHQLAAADFSAAASAYLEQKAWVGAILDVLEWIVSVGISIAAQVAAESIKGALMKGLGEEL